MHSPRIALPGLLAGSFLAPLLAGCMGSAIAPGPCRRTEELRERIHQSSGTARELLVQEFDEANRNCQLELLRPNATSEYTPEARARAVREESQRLPPR